MKPSNPLLMRIANTIGYKVTNVISKIHFHVRLARSGDSLLVFDDFITRRWCRTAGGVPVCEY